MTTTTETHPVVAIENRFYVVDRPFRVGALGDEVALMQVQLGEQPPHAPRMMAMSVLNELVASGDAVFVDAGLIRAAARRLARRREDATVGQAPAGADVAFETRATDPFEDPSFVRASLCSYFTAYLTRSGVEKDTIRYRDALTIDRLFDNNAGRMGGARDAHGFELKARRSDGDMDRIELFDEHAEEWVPLPSTQPGYTAGLSFWEHGQYSQAAKIRRERFGSEAARIRSMQETRRMHEEMLPRAKFRKRARMAALLASPHLRELAGKPLFPVEDLDDGAPPPPPATPNFFSPPSTASADGWDDEARFEDDQEDGN